MTVKNRRSLIITATIIVIAIFFVSFWLLGIFPIGMTLIEKNPTNTTFINKNLSLNKLPLEIREGFHIVDNSITLTKWEFNSTNTKIINLYATDIRNESDIKGLQGKEIGNYTIYVTRDTEFERNRAYVQQQLTQFWNNPDYQVSDTEMINDPNGPYAILWCYRLTPENQKLDNTTMKGWKILVYVESYPPSPEKTIKSE